MAPRAFYHYKGIDESDESMHKLMANYSIISCSSAITPKWLREHTDARLLANIGANSVPYWGDGVPHWDHLRSYFTDEVFFLDKDGERVESNHHKFWYLRPHLDAAKAFLDAFEMLMYDFDGLYVDMAGRGGSWWMKNDLELPESEWGWYHNAQAGWLEFFLKEFRRRFPEKLLMTNTWGPTKGEKNKRIFGVKYPLYTRQMMRQTTGVTIEYPQEADISFLRRVAKASHATSIAWGEELAIPGVVMPGDLRETIGIEA